VVVGAAPRTGASIQNGVPNAFNKGPVASGAFRYAYPSERASAIIFRGPGYFGIDLSLAKSWQLTESQALRFT